MTQKSARADKIDSNIEVYIRVRPLSQSQQSQSLCVSLLDQHIISMRQKQGIQTPTFSFDHIFSSHSNQQEIYKAVTDNIVSNAFQGINGTLFCYGQTCSGKTYTCIGKDLYDPIEKGILPRMIDQILARAQLTPKNIQCKMKISMVQLYNQKIKDLLDSSKSDLKIRSDKSRGIFLQNVTQKYLLTHEQALINVNRGIQNRSVGYTNMNSVSSRSHMLFIITLHQHDFYTGEARSAKITLVDLAGSQKISKTGVEGKSLQQAKKINTSLSALGKVINILSQGKKSSHVPYRDSKLTRLLQESLGGNSITKLIINISPSIANQAQTLGSLRFGFRAKSIKNQARVNKQYTVPQLLQLLNKSQKKVKALTQVIKMIMKQKQMEDLTVKQFSKLYLSQESVINFDSGRSQKQLSQISIMKSTSNKNSLNMSHNSLFQKTCTNSVASKRENIKANKLEKGKLNTKMSLDPQSSSSALNKLSKLMNSSQPQYISLFRSTSITPAKVSMISPTKSSKNKSFAQRDRSDRFDKKLATKLKTLQSDDESFNIQDVDNTNNQELKRNQLVIHNMQGKSEVGSSCTFNSQILNLSIGFQMAPPQPQNKDDRANLQIENTDQNTIEFNLQKIRANLKQIGHMRRRSLFV